MMKRKKLLLIVILCAAAAALCLCLIPRNENIPASLDQKIESAGIDTAGLTQMEKGDALNLLGLDARDAEDALYLTDSLGTREIFIIRAQDAAAAAKCAEKLSAYLNQRLNETRNYLPDVYAVLSGCAPQTAGTLAILVTGENAREETQRLLAGE